MKSFFIILIFFILGNLNYHIFFQKDFLYQGKVKTLPVVKSNKSSTSKSNKDLDLKRNDGSLYLSEGIETEKIRP